MTTSLTELADASAGRRNKSRNGQVIKPPTDTDRLPPHSIEMEQGVLGCVLLDPNLIEQCIETFKSGSDVFYDLRHRAIYEAFLQMYDRLDPIELILLQQNLKDNGLLENIGGIQFLNSLQDTVASAANLSYYLDIVLEKWRLRNLVKACQDAITRAYECDGEVESIISQVEKNVLSINQTVTKPTLEGGILGDRMMTDLENRMGLQGKLTGLDTGFRKLNYMTCGIQYGEQFIIGARPSQGKTALGLSILSHAAITNGVPSLFVSLEMSVEAVMRRFCAMRTRVRLKALREGSFSETDIPKFGTFKQQLKRSPIFFVDGVDGCGIREIASRINRMVLKHGIKLVVIDYLQKIRPSEKQEKKTYEVAEVSSRLKALAHENKIAMITLAQLNRENVKGSGKNDKPRAPRLSDLADSGQIERDADVVGLLHRNGSKTDLIIAKQRDGETGIVPLYFNAQFAEFENLDDTVEE